MALFAVYLFPVTNGKCSCVTRNSRARGQMPSQALHPLTLSPSLPDRVYGAISALEVFLNDMRYINPRFTYLLYFTYFNYR